MKRFLTLVLTAALLCGGCAGPVSPPHHEGLTITDDTGAIVTLPPKPERVAVLFSSYAQIWQLAGGTVSVTVGESVERGFADASAVLVDGGAGHSTIDLEALVAAGPDLVIGTADYAGQVAAAEFCRSVGIPAVCLRVESFADYLAVLELFCALTGQTRPYETHGTQVQREIDAILDAVAGKTGPEVLFLRAGTSQRATKAKTSDDTFACAMVRELGGVNIADGVPAFADSLSLEAVLQADPALLLISPMGDEAAVRAWIGEMLAGPGWRELSCVQTGQVYFLPKDLFHFKPNHCWAEAYQYLADILYPEMKN